MDKIKKLTHFQEKYFKSIIIRNNPDWLFFDVGGVLIDTSEYSKWRTKTVFKIIREYKPKTNWHDFEQKASKASSMIGNVESNTFKLFLKNKQAIQAKQKIDILRKKIDYHKKAQVYPKAKQVIKKLYKDYKLGLMANQPISVRDKLEKAGILKYFSSTKVSDDFNLYKPNLDFFKKILKHAKADPKKSVMIDDNIERGLVPAKKLGMTTVWLNVKEQNNYSKKDIDFVIASLGDLLLILDTCQVI